MLFCLDNHPLTPASVIIENCGAPIYAKPMAFGQKAIFTRIPVNKTPNNGFSSLNGFCLFLSGP